MCYQKVTKDTSFFILTIYMYTKIFEEYECAFKCMAPQVYLQVKPSDAW